MESFVKYTTIAEMHKNLSWFNYNDLENIDDMTGPEILGQGVVVEYNVDDDICNVVFQDIQGMPDVFEPFPYKKGTEFDKQQIEDMKKL